MTSASGNRSRSTAAQYWDTVGEQWMKAQPDGLWRRHSDAVNRALLDRWIPESGVARLLKTDLFDESTSGGLAERLAASARLVVGIDVSAEIARGARRRCPGIQAVAADVRHLPFRDHSFDGVVSLSTLDHFTARADLSASLGELHRILREGGTLVLTMDNPGNPLVGLRNALPWSLLRRVGLVPYQVGMTFGPQQLRKMLADAGFDVVEVRPILHCLRVLAVPVARIFERHASEQGKRALLRWLLASENLSRMPFRYLTGHFVALLARKRP
jgi:SAM-dependent methyltransferase